MTTNLIDLKIERYMAAYGATYQDAQRAILEEEDERLEKEDKFRSDLLAVLGRLVTEVVDIKKELKKARA